MLLGKILPAQDPLAVTLTVTLVGTPVMGCGLVTVVVNDPPTLAENDVGETLTVPATPLTLMAALPPNSPVEKPLLLLKLLPAVEPLMEKNQAVASTSDIGQIIQPSHAAKTRVIARRILDCLRPMLSEFFPLSLSLSLS